MTEAKVSFIRALVDAGRRKASFEWNSIQLLGMLGLLVLTGLLFVAVFAPAITPIDPTEQNLRERLMPPFWAQGGSLAHPLGTDSLGRDLLSRMVYGARVSLAVGVAATTLSVILGVVLGLIAGYSRGFWAGAIVAVADAQLAFPFVLLAVAVAAALGPSLPNVVVVLTISSWVVFARLVRGVALALREQDFVLAARVIGATNVRIIARHILPNLLSVVIVIAAVTVGRLILLESGLSFLGLGVPPPTPTWGGILSDGRNYLQNAPWLATTPGIVITILVLAVTFVGDWLRDGLDPKMKKVSSQQK